MNTFGFLIAFAAILRSTNAMCVDSYPGYCLSMKAICQVQVAHMRMYCPQTCGFCRIPLTPAAITSNPTNCVDLYPKYCATMKTQCKIQGDLLSRYCPRTCGYCGNPVTQSPVTFNPTRNPVTQSPVTFNPTRNPPSQTPPPFTSGPIGTQSPLTCGKSQVQSGRVISGQDAVPNSWPWQILMLKDGRPGCGGSLISPTWVVTAAHCVSQEASTPSRFSVRVGEHHLQRKDPHEVDYPVERVVVHSNWNSRMLDYDIALFKLGKPVKMSEFVSTVCLPDGDVPVGTECFITGWGKIAHPGNMHHTLQQAKMPVVDNKKCHSLNKATIPLPITDRMICSGHGGSTRVSGCHGDSGGPFVCNIGGRWELHGAVSHGSPTCEASQTYTVFARVNFFKQWIESNMNKY